MIAPNDTLVRPLGYGTDTSAPAARTPEGYASPVNSNVAGRLINDLYFPALGHKLNFNVHMMLHALDRCETSEVLSAPKVIAKSGNEAIIRMVQEYYFPESWTEAELVIANGGIHYTPPTPEFGEPTDIGIRFTVTPEVSPDYHTIKLALNPQVLAHTGWSRYDLFYRFGSNTGTSLVMMPEITRRDIIANVKVYDGDTLVLGGMLTENAKGSDDSYPGTANVPLAGWLGRMQTSDKDKTNLMIFVTARIVNPDGLPIRLAPNNGKVDFRR
jgi:general secretion pathway protein D